MDYVKRHVINDSYALYCGDAMSVLPSLPPASIGLSIYSPPFGGMLYTYSSDPRDLSNCIDYEEFFAQYAFIVEQINRLTPSGRMTAVHCMDIPTGNTGLDRLVDFPGDIIRLHARHGFDYIARYHVWKEPLTVRNRTMTKSLHHSTMCADSTKCSIANADYLLVFRKRGRNAIAVEHPTGLTYYAGSRRPPAKVLHDRGRNGDQKLNTYSQWVWRQYASAFWDDVRLDNVLPYRQARDEDDEKHCHPLQLDVINRAIVMWSNPGETILTPFMGVGSEVYCAVTNGRRAIGIELKESYFNQAEKNCAEAASHIADEEPQSTLDFSTSTEFGADSWDAGH